VRQPQQYNSQSGYRVGFFCAVRVPNTQTNHFEPALTASSLLGIPCLHQFGCLWPSFGLCDSLLIKAFVTIAMSLVWLLEPGFTYTSGVFLAFVCSGPKRQPGPLISVIGPKNHNLQAPFEQAAAPNTHIWGPVMKLKCGDPVKAWRQAKREVRETLIERSKARDVISYFELAVRVTAIKLDPDSLALRTMLREIGAEENVAGRGMLSALVVSRPGQRQPDLEFLYLAGRLGKNISDIWQCWLKELKRLFRYWSTAKRKQTPCRPDCQTSMSDAS
jgi:hypothetical protein